MDNKDIAKEITEALLNRKLIPADAKLDEAKKRQLLKWNDLAYQTILETLDRVIPKRKYAEVHTIV